MSETLGSLIDKLTIANLRLWHLEEVKHDELASDSEVADVARKIGVVNKQRNGCSFSFCKPLFCIQQFKM